MGYCMYLQDSRFTVRQHNRANLFLVLKRLSHEAAKRPRGGYSWVDTRALADAGTDTEALKLWRWEPSHNAAGDIVDLDFFGEKLGEDAVLFMAIAPFVERGSYLVMHGEDGEVWRWYFDGTTCVEQSASLSFGKTPDGDIIEGEATVIREVPRLSR